ncbi:hypothetical protein GLOTRDRAFT_71084 [Gloeophyllum trabeum ATCC 11539]|uniref:F-box domain-containing protein n=1 Tax=Gloeophyllum trabeum (strain ATCC 11539 / FP-39264 / Madison 617) TaxID=670483 RepID=S7S1D5_GLOTA|nr:uncharacterized protein GLOTRDRAFT_71084 [Gloeophyllum trabeum ATCC 11539]EPQ59544.1 hypothetical protein GLOTRDRAFT_71084 [Gloeophyllum trabeum ATCC 11539]
MSLSTLPPELLDGVCQNLATADLVALSRASSPFHSVAERLLYRHIHASSQARNLSVVVTLAKRLELASHVQSFSIVVDDASAPIFPSFYRLLEKSLAAMHGLKSLSIFIHPTMSSVLSPPCSEESVYHRLEHFSCSFPFNSDVAAFLSRTPALLELEVDSMPGPTPIPSRCLLSTSIPHLVQFVGSPEQAREVVPGRPVESIHLYGGDLTEDVMCSLSQSTMPVIVLGATTSMSPIAFLEAVTRYLPSVAFLRVTAEDMDSIPLNVESYQQVANILDRLPNLSAFELSGIHWGSLKPQDQKQRVWQARPLSPLGFPADRQEDVDFVDLEDFVPY